MITRPFKYNVDELIVLFEQYKAHRLKQYDIRYDCIKAGERAGETIEIKIPKVLTIVSFCHFIGVTEKCFNNWLSEVSDNIDTEIVQFITHVREEIKDFQLSGATNGVYNATIVSRLNGLNDTINVESSSQPIINISLPGFNANFNKLNENNTIDIDYEVVSPIELTEVNLNE